MTRRQRALPPDDDPAFLRWVNEIGPQAPLRADEDNPRDRSAVVVGLAACAAIAGVTLAICVAWALVFAVVTAAVALICMVGGLLVAGCGLLYLVWRAS